MPISPLVNLTNQVQTIFPIIFSEALIASKVDDIIQIAVERCLSKYEKTKSLETASSTTIEEAVSVTKVVQSSQGGDYNVFDFAFPNEGISDNRIEWYFTDERRLIIETDTTVYVEYIVDPKYLSIDDLNDKYFRWTRDYAVALMKIQEGEQGTAAVLTALPFEFNYQTLLDNARADKDLLEDELEEMYFGCFAGKA